MTRMLLFEDAPYEITKVLRFKGVLYNMTKVLKLEDVYQLSSTTQYLKHSTYHLTWLHETSLLLTFENAYGVAAISRLLKTKGLFCKTALEKRLYSAKDTYISKEPTNRSYPIPVEHHYTITKALYSPF